MIIFYLSWPRPEHLPTLHRRSWKEIDYIGSILLLAASVLVVFAFQNVGSDREKWREAVFIAPLVIGTLCWIGLFAWEALIEKLWPTKIAAAFPPQLLRNHVYTGGVLSTLFLGFPLFLILFAFPLRLQVVNGKSPLLAGLLLLPMLASVAIGSSLGGMISKTKNRLFETLVVATCLVLLGCGLMSTLSDSFALEGKSLGFLTFIGLGFGMSASASTILAVVESPIREHGTFIFLFLSPWHHPSSLQIK
jgi:MFS family permease